MSSGEKPGANEADLLAKARQGDESAFERLVQPLRSQLIAHCYRMLGSYQDSEDALQETLLSAWRALPRFESRSSLRSWLYKIATNACRKQIERDRRRVLPVDFGPAADPHDPISAPLAETVWIEPFPDAGLGLHTIPASPDARYEQRESVELAFVAALQLLPARQRAVLILRDVLGFSAKETGEMLDISSVAVDSALQRAHRTVDERVPEQSQQATLSALSDERVRGIVEEFIAAWERADVGAVVSMLTADATFAMPPQTNWIRGRDAIASFFAFRPLRPEARWRMLPIQANGQPAVAQYLWDEERGAHVAEAITVLRLEGEEIAEIIAFRWPRLFAGFGLPEVWAA